MFGKENGRSLVGPAVSLQDCHNHAAKQRTAYCSTTSATRDMHVTATMIVHTYINVSLPP